MKGTKPLPNPLHWHHMPSVMGESNELNEAKDRAIKNRAIANFCSQYFNDIQSAKQDFILRQNTQSNELIEFTGELPTETGDNKKSVHFSI